MPGHCALALKGMLFRQGAQNHFLAVCIYNSNRFISCLTTSTSNRMGKKHGTDEILCRQVPIPRYHFYVFVGAPLKCYLHIGACAEAPNPSTKSGHGLRYIMQHIDTISHQCF